LPKVIANDLWQVLPEVVIAGSFDSSLEACQTTSGKSFLADLDLERFDAVLIGPGMGTNPNSWNLLARLIEGFLGLVVLDADGLNQIASSSEGWKWLTKRKGSTWITPHMSEFKKLFPQISYSSPLDSAIEAAEISGAGVLLKGAHSVVADPSGASWQLSETAAWVARAGLGDVLAGFVTGLGALGLASEIGASTELLAAGALLHSEAARCCREGSGANDISDYLSALATSIQAGECSDGHLRL